MILNDEITDQNLGALALNYDFTRFLTNAQKQQITENAPIHWFTAGQKQLVINEKLEDGTVAPRPFVITSIFMHHKIVGVMDWDATIDVYDTQQIKNFTDQSIVAIHRPSSGTLNGLTAIIYVSANPNDTLQITFPFTGTWYIYVSTSITYPDEFSTAEFRYETGVDTAWLFRIPVEMDHGFPFQPFVTYVSNYFFDINVQGT